MEKKTEIVKQAPSATERFVASVISQTGSGMQLTDSQKNLLSNYFVAAEISMANAKVKQGNPAIEWKSVNVPKFMQSIVPFVKMGLNPIEPAQLYFVGYYNIKNKNYDLNCMIGYKGLQIKATKYGLDMPDNIRIQVVMENDKFKPLMRTVDREVESYKFEIADNPFDRGEVVGGFIYKEWYRKVEKNELSFYSLKAIEKRKPRYASAAFWGGEQDKWVNGKRSGKETVEGWHTEMVHKTLVRIAYNSIPTDSAKIDESYIEIKKNEMTLDTSNFELAEEYTEGANKETISLPIPAKQIKEPKGRRKTTQESPPVPETKKAETKKAVEEQPVTDKTEQDATADGLPPEPKW